MRIVTAGVLILTLWFFVALALSVLVGRSLRRAHVHYPFAGAGRTVAPAQRVTDLPPWEEPGRPSWPSAQRPAHRRARHPRSAVHGRRSVLTAGGVVATIATLTVGSAAAVVALPMPTASVVAKVINAVTPFTVDPPGARADDAGTDVAASGPTAAGQAIAAAMEQPNSRRLLILPFAVPPPVALPPSLTTNEMVDLGEAAPTVAPPASAGTPTSSTGTVVRSSTQPKQPAGTGTGATTPVVPPADTTGAAQPGQEPGSAHEPAAPPPPAAEPAAPVDSTQPTEPASPPKDPVPSETPTPTSEPPAPEPTPDPQPSTEPPPDPQPTSEPEPPSDSQPTPDSQPPPDPQPPADPQSAPDSQSAPDAPTSSADVSSTTQSDATVAVPAQTASASSGARGSSGARSGAAAASRSHQQAAGPAGASGS